MAFNPKQHADKAKPFKVQLPSGEELTGEYRRNYLTGNTINALKLEPKFREFSVEREDGTTFTQTIPYVSNEDRHKNNIEETAFMLASLDTEDDKGKLKTLGKREEIVELLSGYMTPEDLEAIQKAIMEDIRGPLVETGTDSSAGSAEKES